MNFWQQIKADWCWYRNPVGKQKPGFPLFVRGFWVVACYRIGAWSGSLRWAPLRFLVRILYVVINFPVSVITNADIRSGAKIGQRFTVHTTRGVLITNHVEIGDDCVVNNGVCIVGRANGRGQGVPRIGNDVTFGVGSKALGEIVIGDHCFVGANAVVVHDVPANSLAVGVPANVKPLANAQAGQD